MGLQEGNQVFQSLIAAHQRRLQAAQFAAQQVQAQNEQDYRDKMLKFEQGRADEQHSHNQALLDLTKKAHTLQNYEEQARLKEKWTSSGQVPAGATWQDGATPQTGGNIQLPDAFNDESGKPTMMYLNPLGQDAQNQANIQRTLLAPKTEQEEAEKAANLAESRKNIDENRKWQMDQANMIQNREDARQKILLSSQERIARLKADTKVGTGNGGASDMDPDVFAGHVHDLLAGNESIEGLKKQLPGKDGAAAALDIFNEAHRHGVPLTDVQIKRLQSVRKYSEMVSYMDQAIDEKPDTNNPATGVLASPSLIGNTNFNSAKAAIDQGVPGLAVATSLSNRLSVPEMNYSKAPTKITAFSSRAQDIANRNIMYGITKKAVDDAVPGASPQQRLLLQQTLGFDKIAPTWGAHQVDKANQASKDKADALFKQMYPSAPPPIQPTQPTQPTQPQQGVPQQ